ncbi:hypothetical protein M3Y94_01101000 [Aphelenchoides besseyi]|nr:hypothetical protein M3Y94_01101000 [Aphelenchoides besseyi]KAI6221613.1 hypothetical protein M3Y95_00980700 [Aphelenchoides besseyi]
MVSSTIGSPSDSNEVSEKLKTTCFLSLSFVFLFETTMFVQSTSLLTLLLFHLCHGFSTNRAPSTQQTTLLELTTDFNPSTTEKTIQTRNNFNATRLPTIFPIKPINFIKSTTEENKLEEIEVTTTQNDENKPKRHSKVRVVFATLFIVAAVILVVILLCAIIYNVKPKDKPPQPTPSIVHMPEDSRPNGI